MNYNSIIAMIFLLFTPVILFPRDRCLHVERFYNRLLGGNVYTTPLAIDEPVHKYKAFETRLHSIVLSLFYHNINIAAYYIKEHHQRSLTRVCVLHNLMCLIQAVIR